MDSEKTAGTSSLHPSALSLLEKERQKQRLVLQKIWSQAENSKVGREFKKTQAAYYFCERLVQSSMHHTCVKVVSCFRYLSELEFGA